MSAQEIGNARGRLIASGEINFFPCLRMVFPPETIQSKPAAPCGSKNSIFSNMEDFRVSSEATPKRETYE